MRVRFNIPPEFELAEGSRFIFSYDVLFGGADVTTTIDPQNDFVGTMTVLFNDQVIENFYVNTRGNYTTQIEIPASALASTSSPLQFVFPAASLLTWLPTFPY